MVSHSGENILGRIFAEVFVAAAVIGWDLLCGSGTGYTAWGLVQERTFVATTVKSIWKEWRVTQSERREGVRGWG